MKKYVKLMADYCSSGVWEIDGIMMDMNELPISETLKIAIGDWVSWYETNDSFLNEPGAGDDFDVESFSFAGRLLAVTIKEELPDWTVMYYDESAFVKHFEGGTLTPATETVYEIEL